MTKNRINFHRNTFELGENVVDNMRNQGRNSTLTISRRQMVTKYNPY